METAMLSTFFRKHITSPRPAMQVVGGTITFVMDWKNFLTHTAIWKCVDKHVVLILGIGDNPNKQKPFG